MSNKKNKKIKPPKEYKTQQERQAIVAGVISRFSELGIDIAQYPSLERFQKVLEDYQVEVLESGFSDRYFIPEFNRYIEYRLPAIKDIKEMVFLSAK